MRALLICALTFLISFSAFSQDDPSDTSAVDARSQTVIDQCWAVSASARDSGVTTRMREGTMDSANCMKDQILLLSKSVLFKNSPSIQQEIADSLEQMIQGTGRLYYDLNNTHDACTATPCGTMYTLAQSQAVAESMERVLRDFYRKVAEYEADYHLMNPAKR